MVATQNVTVSDLFAAARAAGVKPVGDKKVSGKMVIYTFRAPAGKEFRKSNDQCIMPSSSGLSVCVGWNENKRGQKESVIAKAIAAFGELAASGSPVAEPVHPGCELSDAESARNTNAEVDLGEALEKDAQAVVPADAAGPVPEVAVDVLPAAVSAPVQPVEAAVVSVAIPQVGGKIDYKAIRRNIWDRSKGLAHLIVAEAELEAGINALFAAGFIMRKEFVKADDGFRHYKLTQAGLDKQKKVAGGESA